MTGIMLGGALFFSPSWVSVTSMRNDRIYKHTAGEQPDSVIEESFSTLKRQDMTVYYGTLYVARLRNSNMLLHPPCTTPSHMKTLSSLPCLSQYPPLTHRLPLPTTLFQLPQVCLPLGTSSVLFSTSGVTRVSLCNLLNDIRSLSAALNSALASIGNNPSPAGFTGAGGDNDGKEEGGGIVVWRSFDRGGGDGDPNCEDVCKLARCERRALELMRPFDVRKPILLLPSSSTVGSSSSP
jgi:hypothetical protein